MRVESARPARQGAAAMRTCGMWLTSARGCEVGAFGAGEGAAGESVVERGGVFFSGHIFFGLLTLHSDGV